MNALPKTPATLTLGNDRLFIAAVVLSIIPLWFGAYLPMIDLPQHAAQITALREMWNHTETFTDIYEVNWFTPYLLGYLLLFALSLVVPISVATKVLVSLAIAALPLVTGRLLRTAGADERWKWLAIPGAYSYAFYWGFLSFIIAAPLAFVFLAQSITFDREPTVRRGVGIALFAILLFYCHAVVLAMAVLFAASYIFGRHFRDWRALLLRALPYATPLPLLALWYLVTAARDPTLQAVYTAWGPWSYRLQLLSISASGRESVTVLAALLTLTIFCMPFLGGARLTRKPERWLPFAAALLAFMLVPHYAIGTAYLYQRLGIFLVPLWLLAWERADSPWRLEWLPMSLVVICTFAQAGRFASFAKETQGFRAVLSKIEPGKNVASMMVDKWSPLFALPVHLHFPSWYQAEKAGIVEFSFVDFFPQMVHRRRDAEATGIDETVAWNPIAFTWEKNRGDKYDYFLVKSNVDLSQLIFKNKVSAVELVARADWWWLYRNKDRAVAGQASTAAVTQRSGY